MVQMFLSRVWDRSSEKSEWDKNKDGNKLKKSKFGISNNLYYRSKGFEVTTV